jgi:tetratricopeptide (TPR) repeat protein
MGSEPGPRLHALFAVLIALLTFSAFLPTLGNQFVNWDDDRNFLENPYYRGLGWAQLRWMWTTLHMGHWIPLTWMTFGVDYLLWGMNPFGYHLTSLLLHTANAVVFYFVALRLLGLALPGHRERSPVGLRVAAGLAALLFAIHPLRVESVAWATERRDVLSGLFYLLAVLAYLRAHEREERGRRWYWGAVGLCACALLSKSMAVSLPVVLVLLDVYPLRRLGGTAGWWSREARRVYAEKIPFVLLAAAASAITFVAHVRLPDNMAPLLDINVVERLAISAYSLSFYLWKTVAPFHLIPFYPIPDPLDPLETGFVVSYGAVLMLSALALVLRRRVPGLAVVWSAYVVILLPVLGLSQNGSQLAADRYTYLAGLGWAILVGAALLSWWPRIPFGSTGLAVCAVIFLGVLTWNQTRVWRNSETLWTHTLSIDASSPIPHTNLASALGRRGRLAEAIAHYRQALRLNPDLAEPHVGLGLALARQGQLEEAIAHYRQALRLKPDLADAHNNWGLALFEQGRPAEAVEHYRQALRLNPDHADAHNNWGVVLFQQGKFEEAIEHYREALQVKPNFPEAYNNWGLGLAEQGKLGEAIAHYRQALRLRPAFSRARANLRHALARRQALPVERIGVSGGSSEAR